MSWMASRKLLTAVQRSCRNESRSAQHNSILAYAALSNPRSDASSRATRSETSQSRSVTPHCRALRFVLTPRRPSTLLDCCHPKQTVDRAVDPQPPSEQLAAVELHHASVTNRGA